MSESVRYGLFPLVRKKGKIWYFWYYPNKNSPKRIRKTTGKTKKWEARQYVEKYLKDLKTKPKIEKPVKIKQPRVTLREFTRDFYIWDKCEWIKMKHGKNKRFGISMAKLRRGWLDKYILPEFGNLVLSGPGANIDKLLPLTVEKWLVNLPLAEQTKNHILYTFKIVMEWAEKNGLIKYNPVKLVEAASRSDYKKKDILSMEELKLLFPADPEALTDIWGSTYWATFFLLMVTSGMRTQEARALLWGDVLWDRGIICIERAVKRHGEVGTTKSEYEKAVFLPDRTLDLLRLWQSESPFPGNDQLIFFGSDADTPHPRKKAGKVMEKQLAFMEEKQQQKAEAMGAEYKPVIAPGKHITPSCLRNTYNTFMRRIIPEEMLRLQMGHRSEAMTDRYDRAEMVEKLLPFQEETRKINEVWG